MKTLFRKGLHSSLIFFTFLSSVFANTIIPPISPVTAPGKMYVGAFGGWYSSTNTSTSQLGTVIFTEAAGGALAVNAFGHTTNPSGWIAGVEVGIQTQGILFNPDSLWMVAPSWELEGYYFGKRTFTGDLINQTDRLDERHYIVAYPAKRSVFLTNLVVNIVNPCFLFHPYIGVGFGGAIFNISGADSQQIDPPELGINHYNANNSDTVSTFAGQVKVGLSYDFNSYVSVLAEYRWLYLSSAHVSFGSTVYDTHAPSVNWNVILDPQHYNMGTLGIRLSV